MLFFFFAFLLVEGEQVFPFSDVFCFVDYFVKESSGFLFFFLCFLDDVLSLEPKVIFPSLFLCVCVFVCVCVFSVCVCVCVCVCVVCGVCV